MTGLRPLALAAAALAAALGCARANPTGLDLSAADGFNLFVFGSATLLNSDVEGTAAVGGNASFNAYSIGLDATIADPLTAAFVVGGNLTAGNGQVYHGGIDVGGTYSGPGYALNSAPGSVTSSGLGTAGLPVNFAVAAAALSSDSANDAALAANGTVTMNYSDLFLAG